MKKATISLWTRVALLLATVALIWWFSQREKASEHAARHCRVVVDPRVEVISIVEILSGSALSGNSHSRYRRDVLDHFSPFAGAAAVKTLQAMTTGDFNFDAVPRMALNLTPPPSLVPEQPFSADIVKRAGGPGKAEQLARELTVFCRSNIVKMI